MKLLRIRLSNLHPVSQISEGELVPFMGPQKVNFGMLTHRYDRYTIIAAATDCDP
jgi:hypothetical protein